MWKLWPHKVSCSNGTRGSNVPSLMADGCQLLQQMYIEHIVRGQVQPMTPCMSRAASLQGSPHRSLRHHVCNSVCVPTGHARRLCNHRERDNQKSFTCGRRAPRWTKLNIWWVLSRDHGIRFTDMVQSPGKHLRSSPSHHCENSHTC